MKYITKRVIDITSRIINEVTNVIHDMLCGTIIIVGMGLMIMLLYRFVEYLLT